MATTNRTACLTWSSPYATVPLDQFDQRVLFQGQVRALASRQIRHRGAGVVAMVRTPPYPDSAPALCFQWLR